MARASCPPQVIYLESPKVCTTKTVGFTSEELAVAHQNGKAEGVHMVFWFCLAAFMVYIGVRGFLAEYGKQAREKGIDC